MDPSLQGKLYCMYGHMSIDDIPQASPGNLQQLEDVVFGGGVVTQTSLIVAVRLTTGPQGVRLVGVAYAEPANHVLGVIEFTDNDQLSELQVSS